jgi:hypothetical protein
MVVYLISRVFITLASDASSPGVLLEPSLEGGIIRALLAVVAATWGHALFIAIKAKDYSALRAVALLPINTPSYLSRKWRDSNPREANLATLRD